jgi:hypothetical protein
MVAETKLGPIPDSHFEKDPLPRGSYRGRWSVRQELRYIAETIRLATVMIEERWRRRRELQGGKRDGSA